MARLQEVSAGGEATYELKVGEALVAYSAGAAASGLMGGERSVWPNPTWEYLEEYLDGILKCNQKYMEAKDGHVEGLLNARVEIFLAVSKCRSKAAAPRRGRCSPTSTLTPRRDVPPRARVCAWCCFALLATVAMASRVSVGDESQWWLNPNRCAK